MIDLSSGFCATKSDASKADLTCVWDVVKSGDTLHITASFGGGTATDNHATATIPWGSTVAITMDQEPKNPNIELGGKVQASWTADQQSYVITFTGAVTRPHVNTVCSSNLTGVREASRSIIIAAHIAE